MFLVAVSSLNLSIRLLYRYWRLHSKKKLLVWSLGSSMLRRYVIFLSLLWLCKGLLVVRRVLCTGSAFERLCMAHFSLLRFEKPKRWGKKIQYTCLLHFIFKFLDNQRNICSSFIIVVPCWCWHCSFTKYTTFYLLTKIAPLTKDTTEGSIVLESCSLLNHSYHMWLGVFLRKNEKGHVCAKESLRRCL